MKILHSIEHSVLFRQYFLPIAFMILQEKQSHLYKTNQIKFLIPKLDQHKKKYKTILYNVSFAFCNCCVTSCSQVKSTLLLSDIIRPFNSYHQAVEGLYVKKIYCHSIISKDACTPFYIWPWQNYFHLSLIRINMI